MPPTWTPYTTTIQLVAANSSLTLPPIKYNLDEGQPLLIVVDFNTAAASEIRAIEGAPPQETSTYFKLGAQEAANSDRANFSSSTVAIFFIEKIEVA